MARVPPVTHGGIYFVDASCSTFFRSTAAACAASPPGGLYTVYCGAAHVGLGTFQCAWCDPDPAHATAIPGGECGIDCHISGPLTCVVGSSATGLFPYVWKECTLTGYTYDPVSGDCVYCYQGADYHYCQSLDDCIYAPDPPCLSARHCTWNSLACAWQCDDPTVPGYCAAGQHWNWNDCACEPNCPAGQQWCVTQQGCISTGAPECSAALNCRWDASLCDWVCDPLPVCPTGPPAQHWDWSLCACTAASAKESDLWSLASSAAYYEEAYVKAGKVRYRRWNRPVPTGAPDVDRAVRPGASTTAQAGLRPRMAEDWQRRRLLVFEDGANVSLTVSHDNGRSWSALVSLFTGAGRPDPVVLPSGMVLYAALRLVGAGTQGNIVARKQYPGDVNPQAEYLFQEPDGLGSLQDILVDNGSFHFVPARESASRLILAATVSGNPTRWASSDNKTWIPL
jgi:hypothetical protein